ncbi:MAG: hybrid sensor histidine kinase/response regulator [Deltaproteobacteria bacterium HGW-Deltaproteobacteria-23]|nr:MAG: hybrid sensor histidine kinase/response regulator [Deltaproteobacteria bacterium HGW-Deltaproteobacteria-23]
MKKQPDRTATTILVIDDEESILNLVEIILVKRGYTVAKATDAFKGMELIAALNPQLVILDYMLPGMDGLEALTRIKTGFPDTYVIIFTGKGSEEIAVEIMKAGASDYILKPFVNQNMIERVENVLKIRDVEVKNRALIEEREQLLHKIKAWNEELEQRIRQESEALQKAHAEVVQSQKLATLGYLSAGMAHEIRNPLNSIALFVQLIKEGVDEAEKNEYVEKILKEVDRVDATLSKLMNTAKRSSFELAEVNIEEVIRKALDSFTPQITAQAIKLQFSLRENLPRLTADPVEIEQIFTNLFLNSIDEMSGGGKLVVELDHDDRDIIIQVSDSGRGIPLENLPNIFDPFFSTKTRGTGMGLPIVLRIVKNYGGKIEVFATGESGTTFLVRLPVSF